MLSGGCFCGFVRYRADGAVTQQTNCHCSICRRTSGAPFVAWFTVPASGFAFTSGTPAEFQSSEHGRRSFCPKCGTPLTFRSAATPEETDVSTCSLDDPDLVPPKDHTFTGSALSWVELGSLPAFEGKREKA
jgi:hypothetical protein